MSNKLYFSKSAHEKLLEVISEKKKELNLDNLYVKVLFNGRTNIALSTKIGDGDVLEKHIIDGGSELNVLYESSVGNFLKEAVIDYVEDVGGSGFKIKNPNDLPSSGCGDCSGGCC